MVKIAILDDYQRVAKTMADWSAIERAHTITVFDKPFDGPAATIRALADFEVICPLRERTLISAEVINALPTLKLIATNGMRNAAIDIAAAAARGIPVCGTGSPSNATPELAFGLILAVARSIAFEDARMRDGHWQTTVGLGLAGKTLGILGLGRLGERVGEIAKAFGMNLIAWSQNLTAERAAACGATLVTKDELFANADVITIHLKLSGRTTGLVTGREFSLMRPTAIIVNTSRGPIIDEAGLLAALNEGRIRGAGIDVYDTEPLPASHPLRSAPRTVLTPHLGYVTEETYRVFYGETVENIQAWLAGKPTRIIKD